MLLQATLALSKPPMDGEFLPEGSVLDLESVRISLIYGRLSQLLPSYYYTPSCCRHASISALEVFLNDIRFTYLRTYPRDALPHVANVNIWQSYKQERDCFVHFFRLFAVCWPSAQVHETITSLLVTLSNIHRLNKIPLTGSAINRS